MRGVGQDEAERVLDLAGGDLVGRREQPRDREAAGVGGRALIAALVVGYALVRSQTNAPSAVKPLPVLVEL